MPWLFFIQTAYGTWHEMYHPAPTTMAVTNTNRIKTDKRDAGNIARCLAFHTYSEVHVPTDEDNAIKEYIRMRDDQKIALKKVKQQILALVMRQGKRYEGGKSLLDHRTREMAESPGS
jgi:transposase